MLKRAIEAIVRDESFHLAVEPAATALQVAQGLLVHAEKPGRVFTDFEKKLLSRLQDVLKESHSLSLRTRRIRYWRNFHQLRISQEFSSLWEEFLQTVELQAEPAFYQEASDQIFEALVKEKLPAAVQVVPLEEATSKPELLDSLSSEDLNAIRYVAGYVLRKVIEKVDANEEVKKFLRSCIVEPGAPKEDLLGSDEWTSSCDRGGLIHVTDATFLLFLAMEDEAREHYKTSKMHQMVAGFKDTVASAIAENEEVVCQWKLMCSQHLQSKESSFILGTIIKKWITIRGFSFASSVIELYKQQKFKTLQKSKALRKTI